MTSILSGSEIAIHALLVISAASAAFFGVYVALNIIGQGIQRLTFLRTPLWRRRISETRANSRNYPRSRVDEIPWETWRVGAAIAGVLVLLLALWGTDYVYLAVFGSAATYVPSFIRHQMRENERWRLRLQVRDFIAELRLALALSVTVSQALENLAGRENKTRTLFTERVRYHVERTLRVETPEKTFAALAEEFKSEDLRKLVVLLRAAQRGGMLLTDALAESADSIEQNIIASAELSIEEMPTRLILPMLFALFPTIMVLALIPAVSLLITSLSGVPTTP